jgi:predicted PurR-regulated permease PerM
VATASVVAGSLVAVSVARLARICRSTKPGSLGRSFLADSLAAGDRSAGLEGDRGLEPVTAGGLRRLLLGAVVSAFSDGILVLLLVLFIIVDGADRRFKYDGACCPRLVVGAVLRGGADVRKYVSITAFTGLLGAVANLVLLLVLGVDGAALWAFLSFWLNFIPNVGFILSVIPPALLALVEFGLGRAIVVAVGFILVNAVVEQVLKPRFIGRELELSALEILVSLLFWSWVLGPVGAIVAVPLAIALKRFIPVLATGISFPGKKAP